MKKYILIALMAFGLSSGAQQTPTSKTRGNNDFTQVDNYITGLKRLGIPTSATDNLDAPGLPQNTIKIIFNTTLGKLRIYNPVSATWTDATAVDLASYLPLTGGTLTGPLIIEGNNLTADNLYTTGGFSAGTYGGGITRLNTPSFFEVLLGNDGNTGIRIRNDGDVLTRNIDGKPAIFQGDALRADYNTSGTDFQGLTIDNHTGDGSGSLNLRSGDNSLFIYQIGNHGDVYGASYNDISKFISYTTSGLGSMRFGVNGEQLIVGADHVKSNVAPTESGDILRYGDALSTAGGTVSGNTTFESGLFGHGPVDIWTGLNSARLIMGNSQATLQHKNPDGVGMGYLGAFSDFDNGQVQIIASTTSGQKALNLSTGDTGRGIVITDQISHKGLEYSDDNDWSSAGLQSVLPIKGSDLRYLKLTGGTMVDGAFSSEIYAGDIRTVLGDQQTGLEPDGLVIKNTAESSLVKIRKHSGQTSGTVNLQTPLTSGVLATVETTVGTTGANRINGTLAVSNALDTLGNAYLQAYDDNTGYGSLMNAEGRLFLSANKSTDVWVGLNMQNYSSQGNSTVDLKAGANQSQINFTAENYYPGENNQLQFKNYSSGSDAAFAFKTSASQMFFGKDYFRIGYGGDRFYIDSAGKTTVGNDIEITDFTKGVILKSPDGTRWRITVSDAGVLSTTSL